MNGSKPNIYTHISSSLIFYRTYKRLLTEHSLWNSDEWVDIPGNHDVMDVLKSSAANNNKRYFLSWEKLRNGSGNSVVTEYVAKKDDSSVRVIAMDLASYPGITMSYAGDGGPKVAEQVQKLLESSETHTHTFLASHFCFPLIKSKKWSSFEHEVEINQLCFLLSNQFLHHSDWRK